MAAGSAGEGAGSSTELRWTFSRLLILACQTELELAQHPDGDVLHRTPLLPQESSPQHLPLAARGVAHGSSIRMPVVLTTEFAIACSPCFRGRTFFGVAEGSSPKGPTEPGLRHSGAGQYESRSLSVRESSEYVLLA